MSELYHHGILGMKWGVRRYQNYDGSYTKKGLERYRKAEAKHNEDLESYKQAKARRKAGDAQVNVREARAKMKGSKRELNDSYDRLKRDKMADEGKKLYQSGKTITENANNAAFRAGAATTVAVALRLAYQNGLIKDGVAAVKGVGRYKLSDLVPAAVFVGGNAVNAVLTIKERSEDKKLRAYYAH